MLVLDLIFCLFVFYFLFASFRELPYCPTRTIFALPRGGKARHGHVTTHLRAQ
jgi:hypothetical protein